ncbi:DUF3106 domain-containing protein [Cognatiluteimonas weifangensis]|uniref:DUF3106 domain-containing protein n=1 Tax=Cognatiluteimonas weifangensis TaxID=2303539 RepID=A0A372DHY8_9GAMM|nr:DUF3106 domain-containing protein [Luteimonas weifangensis]RFP59084.1 DUF3106 domain-containing protein [Luteimonas weifangensis]
MPRPERWLAGGALLWLATAALALGAQDLSLPLSVPPPLQQQLRERQARWQALAPAQQQALQQRRRAWDALPLAERRERRERWQAWQALPPREQWQVRTAADAFAALPPAQQQALRAHYALLDAGTRHGWLLGPTLGAAYPRLQPLLLQVPAAQRAPLLAVLRTLTPAELDALAILAQRIAPPQRDALRRELISTSAANRAAWLRARLER